MNYWIPIDSWNLMESFVTESISPHIFYEKRFFGSDLKRFLNSANEMYNHLLLYKDQPMSDYAIRVDGSLLDTSILEMVDRKGVYFYPKTIYFKRGFVSFFFKDEVSMIGFEAESKIIMEVKTIDKYKDSFKCSDVTCCKNVKRIYSDSFSFEGDKNIEKDSFFNAVKGGLVAYVCGILASSDPQTQNLLLAINDLKNSMVGLHTMIMMNDSGIETAGDYMALIAKVRMNYKNAGLPSTDIFKALQHQFLELTSLATLRSKELAFRKTEEYYKKLKLAEMRKSQVSNLLVDIERKYNISSLIKELEDIKAAEVERGKEHGKTRKLFPKDSAEYARKVYLKSSIESFKASNAEYKELRNEYNQLKEELSVKDGSQYDSVIQALFTRISDNINDLHKSVKSNAKGVHISSIDCLIVNDMRMCFNMANATQAEIDYYSILANLILHNSITNRTEGSESYILSLIVESAKSFKLLESSKTKEGESILSCLGDYWRYKNQKKDEFSIPKSLTLFSAVMSFYVKNRGFEQIERFMLNKGYKNKEFAYLLLGLLHGYASLPKTLTNNLYQSENSDSETVLETYLLNIN